MYKSVKAKLHKVTSEGTYIYAIIPEENLKKEFERLSSNGVIIGELKIDDGRRITSEQRKKVYATLLDIADFLGYPPEELKEIMKFRFISATGAKYFSLSNCSVTTARHFISNIIEFAIEWSIPLLDKALERTDDINALIYACIKYRKCTICGSDAEIHHWDPVGMGNDRKTLDDSNLRKICLCRKHHSEVHQIGRDTFERKYHVYGIIYKE